MSSTNSEAFKFPKLNGTNYATWATQMMSALDARELGVFVEGLETCPEKPSTEIAAILKTDSWKAQQKEYLTWIKRDRAVKGLMMGAADESQWPHVASCATSKEVWDTWKRVHVINQQGLAVHYHFRDLYMKKYVDGASMADHIALILAIRKKIIDAGEEIKDLHVARALVLSLPQTTAWETVTIQLFNVESEKFTLELVTSKLQSEANRQQMDKSSSEAALAAKGQQRGRRPRAGKNAAKDADTLKDVKCYNCNQMGHYAANCPKENKRDEKAKKGKKLKETANLSTDQKNPGERSIGHIYMTASVTNGDPSSVVLDSGVTSHYFCNKGFFSSYLDGHPEAMSASVTVSNKTEVLVVGYGAVKMSCSLPGGNQVVKLNRAYYVPHLAANLVSLGVLQKSGATYHSEGQEDFVVELEGSELFRARLSESGLYHVCREGGGVEFMFAAASSGSMCLWHRQMGHLHLEAIREMEQKELVEGLTISSPKDFDYVCEGCAWGKQHREPFPKATEMKYKKMDLLVVDLTGPVNIETWSGMKYALVAVEAHSRFGIGELLVSKDEAAESLKAIVARLERQSGTKLKRICSDNGSEFVNETIRDFCRKNGIIHETTVPYTPQHNGLAERTIQTYFDMVRCMLHGAKMDLRYWGEVFNYAVYIRNVSPTASLMDKVPYEAWYERKPQVGHLRIFSLIAFAQVLKKLCDGKLAPTSVKCRMLGWWADETKGYCLEELESQTLVTSRDVQFVEDESLTELATIDSKGPSNVNEELTSPDLANEEMELEQGKRQTSSPYESEHSESNFETKPRFQPEPSTPSKPPPTLRDASKKETTAKEPAEPPKKNKWADLPPRNHPTRNWREPKRYSNCATEDKVDEAANAKNINQNRAFVSLANKPNTYSEAMLSPSLKQWEKAFESEIEQLLETGTLEWVPKLPPGKTSVESRVVFKEKRDGDGKLTKHKARLVAQGCRQIPGQDFDATHAGVMRYTTLQSLLSLAACEDWEIHQVDVKGAYLQGDLDEEIYMRFPVGWKPEGKSEGLWRLRKLIYGLKQAGRQWKKKLDKTMAHLGFTKAAADDCLYVVKDKEDRTEIAVLVYVVTVVAKSKELVDTFKRELSKQFEITDGGEITYILGIQVVRDRPARTIALNQTAYIRSILEQFGMRDSTPVSTPLVVKHQLSADQSPSTPEEASAYREYAKEFAYLEGVGLVLYCTQTRPDIQHAIGVLAQFGSNPGKPHLEVLKRVLRYLKGTAHYSLLLGSKEQDVDLVGWTDSDWASDLDLRWSTGGFVFDIAGGSVSWSSKKQPMVALSTVEAEYMAASNMTKEAVWLRSLLTDLGFSQTAATLLHADNQGCIALSKNPIAHSRAKHIDIRHHFIRERVNRKEIDLRFCSTKDMLADIFTKQLPRDVFERFRLAIGVGDHGS